MPLGVPGSPLWPVLLSPPGSLSPTSPAGGTLFPGVLLHLIQPVGTLTSLGNASSLIDFIFFLKICVFERLRYGGHWR